MKVTLETERLILRPWRDEDAEPMFLNWASDPEVTKYMTWNPHKTVEETKERIAKWIKEYEKPERIAFAIVLKENNALIGCIDVNGYINGVPVIGYVLSRAHWRNGYMTEACKRLVDFLFSLGYKTIKIDAFKENIASNKVIQKCGGIFQYDEWEFIEAKGKKALINCYLIKQKE